MNREEMLRRLRQAPIDEDLAEALRADLERISGLERENTRLIGEYDENIRMAQRAERMQAAARAVLMDCEQDESGFVVLPSDALAELEAALGADTPVPPSIAETARLIHENYGEAIRKADAPETTKACPDCEGNEPGGCSLCNGTGRILAAASEAGREGDTVTAPAELGAAVDEVVYEIERMVGLGEVPQLSQIEWWATRLREPGQATPAPGEER